MQRRQAWCWLLFGLLALAAAIGLARPSFELRERVGHNNNEGWNAYHVSSAMEGRPLYPPTDALIVNNYPPLSFYVVGAVSELGIDVIHAGRYVSLLSLLVVALCCGRIATHVTGSAFSGGIAALLVLATTTAHFQNYVGMNDPQMLGHAFQYAGMLLLLRGHLTRGNVVGSALLLLLGGLVKHNLLALPLAVTIWLARRRGEALRWWIASALGVGAFTLALLYLLFGEALFAGVIGHQRVFGSWNLAKALERWIVPVSTLVVGAAALLLFRGRDSRTEPLLWAAFLAILIGVSSSLGAGVNYNVVFDAVFVASILNAIAVQRARTVARDLGAEQSLRLDWLAVGWLAAASLNPLLALPARTTELAESVQNATERRRQAADDLAFVQGRPGPVLCEDPAVCFWAGRSFEVDFFNLGQRIRKGVTDGAALRRRIEAGEFGLVQVDRPTGTGSLGSAIDRALLGNYEVDRTSAVNGWFFVPRGPEEASPRTTGEQ